MTSEVQIRLQSDWLPAAEFARLVEGIRRELPNIEVSESSDGTRRSLEDPTVVVAVITSAAALAAPFVTRLADRIFAKRPSASLVLTVEGVTHEVTITASQPPHDREQAVRAVADTGTFSVTIRRETA